MPLESPVSPGTSSPTVLLTPFSKHVLRRGQSHWFLQMPGACSQVNSGMGRSKGQIKGRSSGDRILGIDQHVGDRGEESLGARLQVSRLGLLPLEE